MSAPFGDGLTSQAARAELGVERGATAEEVKKAYRRQAMASHPDRNPDDAGADGRFKKVHAAYETLMRNGPDEEDEPGLTITVTISGFGPTVSHLAPAPGSVFVGSSDGKVVHLDSAGHVRGVHALGEGWAKPVVGPDGTLAAAWCDGILFYLQNDELRSLAEFDEPPRDMGIIGDDLFLWHRNRLDVVDTSGRARWGVEFSKNITNVAADGDRLLCGAGVLAVLKRASR
ncbi:MAG: J domain-containing protein [Dehalococcoidia bacterium]|nr:J domain-containing protein [Dehalococcoidia bacterium]